MLVINLLFSEYGLISTVVLFNKRWLIIVICALKEIVNLSKKPFYLLLSYLSWFRITANNEHLTSYAIMKDNLQSTEKFMRYLKVTDLIP